METVFVWWQENRPALFRLVSAIMRKHHQLRMGALCSVYRDTQQIITIDCYPETKKKDRLGEGDKEDRKMEEGQRLEVPVYYFTQPSMSSINSKY